MFPLIVIACICLTVLCFMVSFFSIRLPLKEVKMEMERAYDAHDRAYWKQKKRELYVGTLPLCGKWLSERMHKHFVKRARRKQRGGSHCTRK